MKKTFSARRVPRKIGNDDDEDGPQGTSTDTSESSVKRPFLKSKNSSSLRGTFSANEEDTSGVSTPKKSALSRIAIQRNAEKRSSFSASDLHHSTDDADVEGPKYSADALRELKASTPSTPQQYASDAEEGSELALDLSTKFGSSLQRYQQEQSSAIPSAAEIAEKKARRARLAQETKADEYISLDPDDPGWEEDEDGNVVKDADGRLVLREKDKYGLQESRLVRDDEEVMEGFDEFTGDTGSRISMGASALPVNRQARRNEISAQITLAEEGSDSEASNADQQARNAAFEAAQTRHGTYAENATTRNDPYADSRAKTPPEITPLPHLDAVIKRLRATLLDMETRKRTKETEMEGLTKEKFRIGEEEVRVQRQLKEVAEKFRDMKIEKGIIPKPDGLAAIETDDTEPPASIAEQMEDSDNEDFDGEGRGGLGLGAAGAANSWFGGQMQVVGHNEKGT